MVIVIRVSLRKIGLEDFDGLGNLKSALPKDDKPYREIITVGGRYPAVLKGTGKPLIEIQELPVITYKGMDDGSRIEPSYHLVEGCLRFFKEGFELVGKNTSLGGLRRAEMDEEVLRHISSLEGKQQLFGGFVVKQQLFDIIYSSGGYVIAFEGVIPLVGETPPEPKDEFEAIELSELLDRPEITAREFSDLTGIVPSQALTKYYKLTLPQTRERHAHYNTQKLLYLYFIMPDISDTEKDRVAIKLKQPDAKIALNHIVEKLEEMGVELPDDD